LFETNPLFELFKFSQGDGADVVSGEGVKNSSGFASAVLHSKAQGFIARCLKTVPQYLW
jgi:hypothetical protein